jgi:hypothetical protein
MELKLSFLSLLREEREGKLHEKQETTMGQKLPCGSFGRRRSFEKKCAQAQHLLDVRNYAEKLVTKEVKVG